MMYSVVRLNKTPSTTHFFNERNLYPLVVCVGRQDQFLSPAPLRRTQGFIFFSVRNVPPRQSKEYHTEEQQAGSIAFSFKKVYAELDCRHLLAHYIISSQLEINNTNDDGPKKINCF